MLIDHQQLQVVDMEKQRDARLEVAVIGAGIAGLTVAIGLISRGIPVKVFERAEGFREIGAGIGLSPNAERAMLALDPRIHQIFRKVATPNTEDWFQYVDGFNVSNNGDGEAPLFKVYLGNKGFEGCRRTEFLDELSKIVPTSCISFNKELVAIEENSADGRVVVHFADGSTSKADVVIGCDGLRSRVRGFVLGRDHCPSYTHKFAFRGVVPMAHAIEAIGEQKSMTRFMHLGPNGHVLTFPVAMCTKLNVVAFVSDPGDWPSQETLTLPATKEEALQHFAKFGPVVTAIMGLLDERLDKWGIFDLYDHPVSSYVSKGGHVCLVGDAAHGSAPHHGAGAGFAIEDSLALAITLEQAVGVMDMNQNKTQQDAAIRAALLSYEDIRHDRTQWLVKSSRFMGELYEWQVTECGSDLVKGQRETERRSHIIWDYDIDRMARETRELFEVRWKDSSNERRTGGV